MLKKKLRCYAQIYAHFVAKFVDNLNTNIFLVIRSELLTSHQQVINRFSTKLKGLLVNISTASEEEEYSLYKYSIFFKTRGKVHKSKKENLSSLSFQKIMNKSCQKDP